MRKVGIGKKFIESSTGAHRLFLKFLILRIPNHCGEKITYWLKQTVNWKAEVVKEVSKNDEIKASLIRGFNEIIKIGD